jgi:hypothetical protein
MSKKIAVFEVQGGIGKHIAFTGALAAYKKANPDNKCIVVCAWPEIMLGNSDVERVYPLGNTPYFYQDFVYKQDPDIFIEEPYKRKTHILKTMNLRETWCDMFGVPYDNEMPKLFLNSAEMESGRVPPMNKPLLIFQPFGGPEQENQLLSYSWMRDIHPPIAQEMVNAFSQKYHVVHICYKHHPKLENCERFENIVPKKTLFSMLLQSHQRVLIDSSLQHAAAALGLKSQVAWIGTQPKVFGYDFHDNFTPLIEFGKGTIDSYMYDYNFHGSSHECPFDDPGKLLDYNKIVENVMSS